MENQINMGDQNTQQVGQKLTSRPVQIPEKPKVKYWMISVAIFALLLFTIIAWYLYTIPNNQEKKLVNKPQTQDSINQKENKVNSFVAFEKDDGLYVVDLRNKEVKQLQNYNANTGDHFFTFTPSKNSLAISFKNNIWEIDLNGKFIKQLTDQGREETENTWGVSVTDFTYSPDGQQAYYRVTIDFPARGGGFSPKENPQVQEGVWVTSADGKTTKYLGNFAEYVCCLAWTSGSNKITYTGIREYYSEGLKYGHRFTNLYDLNTGSISDLFGDKELESVLWSTNNNLGVARINGDKNIMQNWIIDAKYQLVGKTEKWESTDQSAYHWDAQKISPIGSFVILTRTFWDVAYGIPKPSNYEELRKSVDVYVWDTKTLTKNKLPISVDPGTQFVILDDNKSLIYSKGANLYKFDMDTQKEELIIISSRYLYQIRI